MSNDVLKILDMVKAQTITPEEGEKLIKALSEPAKTEAPLPSVGSTTKKMLRIVVDANEGSKSNTAKVTVNIPLAIAKQVTSLLPLLPKEAKDSMNKSGFDIDALELPKLIESFENGELTEDLVSVDADDGEDKVFVRVYVD